MALEVTRAAVEQDEATRAQVAATPMTGWGPSSGRYLRLVFSSEPAERLTDLRARFDTALS